MKHKDFDNIVRNRLNKCCTVLASKDKEYSSDDDRLHNFKVAADMTGCTPEKALWGMWVKHLVSVLDLVNDPSSATEYLLNEKIGDVIDYALLLEGLLRERNDLPVINEDGEPQ